VAEFSILSAFTSVPCVCCYDRRSG